MHAEVAREWDTDADSGCNVSLAIIHIMSAVAHGESSSHSSLLIQGHASYSTMGNPQEVAASAAHGDHHGIDDAAARRILRKIDWHIIPLLFVTYVFNFMDKTILSSAAVFGLKDDNHLVGQRK